MRLWPGLVVAIALAGMGVSGMQGSEKEAVPRAPMAPQASSSADATRGNAAETQPVQPLYGAESGPPEGAPMSTTLAGRQEPPHDAPAEERALETTVPQDFAMAGPPVTYTDPPMTRTVLRATRR